MQAVNKSEISFKGRIFWSWVRQARQIFDKSSKLLIWVVSFMVFGRLGCFCFVVKSLSKFGVKMVRKKLTAC